MIHNFNWLDSTLILHDIVLYSDWSRDRNFALHCSMLVVIGLLDLICQRIYVVYVVEIIQHADLL